MALTSLPSQGSWFSSPHSSATRNLTASTLLQGAAVLWVKALGRHADIRLPVDGISTGRGCLAPDCTTEAQGMTRVGDVFQPRPLPVSHCPCNGA